MEDPKLVFETLTEYLGDSPEERSPVLKLLFKAPKRFAIFMMISAIAAACMGLVYKALSGRADPDTLDRIRRNEATIRHFFVDGGVTLTELAKLSGLSISTVREHLQELVEEGFVRKEGTHKGAKYHANEEILEEYVINREKGGVLLNMLELYEEYVVFKLAKLYLLAAKI